MINNKNCFIFNTILDLLLESPPQRGGPLSNPPILHWIHAGGTSGEDNILQGASAKAKSAFNSFVGRIFAISKREVLKNGLSYDKRGKCVRQKPIFI